MTTCDTQAANAQAQVELAASRARIVAVGDAARRRIERNLHDGAQQRLVTLGLGLRQAHGVVLPGADELAQRLEGAVTEVAGVLEELGEIARGLHPAVLTDSHVWLALEGVGSPRAGLPPLAWMSGWRGGSPSWSRSPPITRWPRR